MSRKERSLLQRRHLKSALLQTELLRKEAILTDVTLICDGRQFPVHRIVLASVSTFFLEAFKTTGNVMIIDFMNCQVLETILLFCYTGRIVTDNQTPAFLKDLTEAAIKCEIQLLYNHCLKMLFRSFVAKDLGSQWQRINELNSQLITNIFLDDLATNFGALQAKDGFLALEPEQLRSIIQSPQISMCHQDLLLKGIMLWVKHNVKSREKYFSDYLESVDFQKLSDRYLLEIAEDSLFKNNIHFLKFCHSMYLEQLSRKTARTCTSKSRHMNTIQNTETTSAPKSNYLHNTENIVRNSIAQTKYLKATENTEQFQRITDQCSSISESNLSIQSCSVSFGKDNRYGFKTSNLKLETLQAHKESKDKGSLTLTTSRKLFIISGNKNPLFSVYDIDSKQWRALPSDKLQNMKPSAICCFDGFVYCFGEFCTESKFNFCFAFDTRTYQWLTKTGTVLGRSRTQAVALDDYIYVIGNGNHSQIFMERYDPRRDEWKPAQSIETDCSWMCPSVTSDGKFLYAAVWSKIYRYTPEEDDWQMLHIKFPDTMRFLQIVNGNDKIYLLNKFDPKTLWSYDPSNNKLEKEVNSFAIRLQLKCCDTLINLHNPKQLEILVIDQEMSYVYKPPNMWERLQEKPATFGRLQALMIAITHK